MFDIRAKAKTWQVRRALAVTAAAVSAAALLAPAVPATADTPPPLGGTVPVAGAQIIGEQWLSDRTLQLTVATDAFSEPAPVEVVFPVGYDPAGTQNWPVTYHTHGTNGNETWFRTVYAGEELTASYPSIVVVPKGESGYWSDWFSNGPRNYESFVMQQLIPLVDANFHTIPDREHRAIMGDSMGGYGSLMLAARHPDKFAAAASLSGAVDSNYAPGMAAISASPTAMLAPADSIYGPRLTEEVRWRGHNPTDLAKNLRGVDLQLFNGNGILDPTRGESAASTAFCPVEGDIIRPETISLHQTLASLGISHTWDDMSWGCHSPAMFKYQIAQAIQRFQTVFAQGATAPQTFDYTSINPSFDVYGWRVATDAQRALEFLTLNDVNANGLSVTGSGTTTITTPPLFKGAKQVTVSANGTSTRVQPDKNGSITFTVRLGLPNTLQQYTLGAVTRQTSTVVTFAR
ncbi:prolyl oligopeptidase family serine peptidase [Pseudarthrobacter equi]|uniref:alpha/beta hydrolase n=1 Tax=Pseudarthrobacter equi TaxID=728066 RepID=UPI0021BF9ABE|nr:alpha/beta hydrolase family protein [Pseudarthrobacter equi]MCT9623969.1 prolyl oligopeptidase family serine peptidase [Pseudarthrobacter equi]